MVHVLVYFIPRLLSSCLQVFAFSSENWSRSTHEVSFLMSLFMRLLRAEASALHARGVRLRVIGDRSRLPDALVKEVEKVR